MKKKFFFCAVVLSAGMLFSTGNAMASSVYLPEPTSMSSSESSNWDSILDSYEKYVNQYIAVYKKVQAGDMSAYASMASLMEKYQKLASQLENAQDEMTSAQEAHYMKITNKLANAIQ